MKKRLTSYCFLGISLLGFCVARAQGDYDFTQRWLNTSLYNPAATGNSFLSKVSLHARTQWLGTDGAPATQAMSFDTYAEQLHSGFGILLSHDRIGYLNAYVAKASYAYYISIGRMSVLSFGLSGGLYNRHHAINNNMFYDVYDPALATKRTNHNAPEFDFGVEYKGPFKLGASIRHLGFYDNTDWPKPGVSIWAYASSRYNLSQAVSIEPCLSYTHSDKTDRYEAGVLFYFQKPDDRWIYSDQFWIGTFFRLHGEVSVLAGMSITPKIRIGYSFDYGTGHLSALSRLATHEVFVSWQFGRIFYKDVCCPSYSLPDIKYRKQKNNLEQ